MGCGIEKSDYEHILSNLYLGWSQDYGLKLYNDGSLDIVVGSSSGYLMTNDPDSLREYIFVEVFDWDDQNHDGIVDVGETPEASVVKKTVLKWKTEGIDLGQVDAGALRGYLLRFSTPSIPDTKRGFMAAYDFEFEGTTEGVIQ